MRWLLLEKILRILTSLLISIFAITTLGISGLGTYSTYLLPLSLTLTLSSAVTRNALRATPSDTNLLDCYRHSFLCEVAISFIFSFLSLIYYRLLLASTTSLSLILSAITLACSLLNCFELDELSYLRHGFDKRLSFILLSQLFLSVLVKIVVLLFIRTPLSFFSVQLVDQIISVFLILAFCPKGSFVLRSFTALPLRGLFRSTYYYCLSLLSKSLVEVQLILQSRADQFLLAFLLPASSFGLYTLYLRFVDLSRSLHSTVSSHFIARICRSTLLNTRRSLTRRYLLASALISISTTFLFILSVNFSRSYYSSISFLALSPTVVLSCCIVLLLNLLPLVGYSLSLLSRVDIPVKYSIIIASTYIGSLWFIASTFGLAGAIASLAVLYFLQAIPYLTIIQSSISYFD